MTKKLEEEFNLPEIDDLKYDPDKLEFVEEEPDLDDLKNQIVVTQQKMEMSQKVDAALPIVDGLEILEKEMDEYAEKAMSAFDELINLGRNVEDRHVAPIYDSASKMLTAGLQAKQAKLDKKLKMVELQMRKQNLDMKQLELDEKLKLSKNNDDEEVEGRIIGNRTDMLAEIMKNMKQNDK